MNDSLFSSNSVEWETPQDLFDKLNDEFRFTLDPCSTHENAKCEKHYTKQEDGLTQSWNGETVFCNPPYGREISRWVEKAYMENKQNGVLVVLLIPARTDTKWFHEYIYKKHEIRFLRGRLHFNNSKNSAPFPSMIVVMRDETWQAFAKTVDRD